MSRRRWLILVTGTLMMLLLMKGLKACAFSVIEMKSAGFVYDAQALQSDHASTNTVEPDALTPLTMWQAQEGLSPSTFFIRARLHSYGNAPSPVTPIKVILWVKTGEFLVNTGTLLVDTQNLQHTATWAPLMQFTFNAPLMAPNETQDVVSPSIHWAAYMQTLHHRYPTAVKAQVSIQNQTHKTVTIQFPVIPNHFATEDLEH